MKISINGVIAQNPWNDPGITGLDQIRKQLEQSPAGQPVDVEINSIGGSVLEGMAIYNALKNHDAPVNIHISGAALSIASVIAMSGDMISMDESAFMMIHDAASVVYGTAEDFLAQAAVLEKMDAAILAVYESRTKQDMKKLAEWKNAETWFTAVEARDAGFVSSVTPNKAPPEPTPFTAQAQAVWNPAIAFKHAPAAFNLMRVAPHPTPTPATALNAGPENGKPETGQKEGNMNAIFTALGLPENASEIDAVLKANTIKDASTKILEATNQTSIDAALGTITAWKVKADRADALEAENAARVRSEALSKLPPAALESLKDAPIEAVNAALAVFATLPTTPMKQPALKNKGDEGLTPEELELAKQFGVSAEAVLKTKAAQANFDHEDEDDDDTGSESQ